MTVPVAMPLSFSGWKLSENYGAQTPPIFGCSFSQFPVLFIATMDDAVETVAGAACRRTGTTDTRQEEAHNTQINRTTAREWLILASGQTLLRDGWRRIDT